MSGRDECEKSTIISSFLMRSITCLPNSVIPQLQSPLSEPPTTYNIICMEQKEEKRRLRQKLSQRKKAVHEERLRMRDMLTRATTLHM